MASSSSSQDRYFEELVAQGKLYAAGKWFWGEKEWTCLHQKALAYPERNPTQAQRDAVIQNINSMAVLLPCTACQPHWAEVAADARARAKEITADRASFVKWTVDTHNKVNARLGKKVLSYEEAVKVMMSPVNTSSSTQWRTETVVMVVAGSVVVGAFAMWLVSRAKK